MAEVRHWPPGESPRELLAARRAAERVQIYEAWQANDQNAAAAARQLRMTEDQIRYVLRVHYKIKPRVYGSLPVSDSELYELWLRDGATRQSAKLLADLYKVNPQTVRLALRRHLNRTDPI